MCISLIYLYGMQLYLAGESFAGTYIPYFAKRMLELNNKGERSVSETCISMEMMKSNNQAYP